jgi:hypothetical protein
MAVVLKKTYADVNETKATLTPVPAKEKKIEYEFPYDEMYLLYDHIMKEKRERE